MCVRERTFDVIAFKLAPPTLLEAVALDVVLIRSTQAVYL